MVPRVVHTTSSKLKNLTFYPTNSIAVLFSKSRTSGKQHLQMNGKKIRPNIKKIDTCKGLLINIINKYIHTLKAKQAVMKWIYTGLIRPKFTYAYMPI